MARVIARFQSLIADCRTSILLSFLFVSLASFHFHFISPAMFLLSSDVFMIYAISYFFATPAIASPPAPFRFH